MTALFHLFLIWSGQNTELISRSFASGGFCLPVVLNAIVQCTASRALSLMYSLFSGSFFDSNIYFKWHPSLGLGDNSIPIETIESIGFICSYRSRGTLMSYTDHSVQRRFKSNAPNVRTQAEHEKHCATRQSEGFSICTSPLFTMDLL